jgi:hypothetical protein
MRRWLRRASAARCDGAAPAAAMGRVLVACQLYEQLDLDRFWSARLPDSRQGTR